MNRWRDWWEQALRYEEKAKLDLEHGYYEWACFTAGSGELRQKT